MKASLPFVTERDRWGSPGTNRLFSIFAGLLLSAAAVGLARALEVTGGVAPDALSQSETAALTSDAKWVSGFYVGWMADTYPPDAIDFSSLSHVMMFSVLPHNDGTLDTTFFGAGASLAVEVGQRAHGAGKKAILAVGGAGYDAQFRAAASAPNVDKFVQNLVSVVTQYGYDGLDIDWEPILSTDYSAVLTFVSKLRAALPTGSLITADVGWLNANFPLSSTDAQFYQNLAASLDQMNIMTYGMADNWGGWLSWHSSALFGAAANLSQLG